MGGQLSCDSGHISVLNVSAALTRASLAAVTLSIAPPALAGPKRDLVDNREIGRRLSEMALVLEMDGVEFKPRADAGAPPENVRRGAGGLFCGEGRGKTR